MAVSISGSNCANKTDQYGFVLSKTFANLFLWGNSALVCSKTLINTIFW